MWGKWKNGDFYGGIILYQLGKCFFFPTNYTWKQKVQRFGSAVQLAAGSAKTTAKNNMWSWVLTCSQTVRVWVWQSLSSNPPGLHCEKEWRQICAQEQSDHSNLSRNPFKLSCTPSLSFTMSNPEAEIAIERDRERETFTVNFSLLKETWTGFSGTQTG